MGTPYLGKILWVDLTRGTLREETLPPAFYETQLSGIGLAVKLLLDRIPPGADPLGPENVLAMVSGLLTGCGSLFTGRWMVAGKSPLTGGWGDANCGGNFAPAIKQCGYDGLFFTGISPRPVYLIVRQGRAELCEAGDIWGQDTYTTERLLKEKNGGARMRVACLFLTVFLPFAVFLLDGLS
ncbi:MAG: hypothetical protein JJV98_17800, partial [Desulfosarcina sp.]|nr:hypothetical protein [Desulfobacterales bacterium]